MEPDTTAVIPFWDYDPDQLRECVESIRAASATAVRTLIMDNRSQVPIPPLRDVEVHQIERRVEIGEAKNHGLRLVRTPFVLFVDADDRLPAGAIDEMRTLLRQNPDAVGATGVRRAFYPADGSYRITSHSRRARRYRAYPRLLMIANALQHSCPFTGALLRTEVLNAAGGFSAQMRRGEDWDASVAVLARGRIVVGDRPTYDYRIHAVHRTITSEPHGLAAAWRVRAHVRARLRRDPATPRWLLALLPAIAVGHAYTALRTFVRGKWQRRRFGRAVNALGGPRPLAV
jgi:GT2 family glycosyltransferase